MIWVIEAAAAHNTSNSSILTEETEQDRLRSPKSLLSPFMVVDCSVFNAGGMRYVTTFLFWCHAVTTPYLHRNRMQLEVIKLAVETYLVFEQKISKFIVDSTQHKVQG